MKGDDEHSSCDFWNMCRRNLTLHNSMMVNIEAKTYIFNQITARFYLIFECVKIRPSNQ